MYNLWEKYRAWIGRRDRKNLEWWSRKRVQGKTKYILWAMFTWAGLMILVISAMDYYDGNLRMEGLPLKILIYLFGGYIIGWLSWSEHERKYLSWLKANRDANSPAE